MNVISAKNIWFSREKNYWNEFPSSFQITFDTFVVIGIDVDDEFMYFSDYRPLCDSYDDLQFIENIKVGFDVQKQCISIGDDGFLLATDGFHILVAGTFPQKQLVKFHWSLWNGEE